MRRITLRLILFAIGSTVGCIFIVFVISNSGGDTHKKESQLVTCNCPSTQEIVPKTIPSVSTVTPKAAIFRPCIEIEKTSPVQRAIIIYYPHHQSEYFFPEVRW
jgi:hypothetical protein